MFTLETPYFIAKIKVKGAELCSLMRKSDNKEYIWQADPTYWAKHAPVLFPVIGVVSKTRDTGVTRHGFARDMDFKCTAQSANRVSLELHANETTKAIYPYDFILKITYTLTSTGLNTAYEVHNLSKSEMPFSLGAHPAFNCNLKSGRVSLRFEKKEQLDGLLIDLSTGLLNGKTQHHESEDGRIKLVEETFDIDTLIFKNLNSKWVLLEDPASDVFVRVGISGFEYLGIWSPKAPFVCIEPWHGVADYLGDTGTLFDKKGIRVLKPMEVFNSSFDIQILSMDESF